MFDISPILNQPFGTFASVKNTTAKNGYIVRKYNPNSESSEKVGKYDTLMEAKRKANEIGKNGEVWDENDELCIYKNR